jgi:hypothetical protein
MKKKCQQIYAAANMKKNTTVYLKYAYEDPIKNVKCKRAKIFLKEIFFS